MADRRDDERKFRGERRDPETERRIDRLADRYRGSDERGYGGGERLRREWEREDMRGAREPPRDRGQRERPWGYGDRTPHTSLPSHGGPGHSDLVGLYDMDDLSELRERYRELRRQRDDAPRYGLGDTYRSGAPRPMGRGPKGYQRSDERIREDICERLMTSPYDASDVEVTVHQGEVTLVGTVRSRADKWGIEDVADSVLGVQDVHNQIRLNRGEAQTSTTTLAGDTGNLHS